jgi:hypothetical protein
MGYVGTGCLTDAQMILLKLRGTLSGKLRNGGVERGVEKLACSCNVTVASDVGKVRAGWGREKETRGVAGEDRRGRGVSETTANEG